MEITDLIPKKEEKQHHHWLLPGSIRCVIAGPSECGKTSLLLNLLLKKGYLTYDRLHLYCKSLEQQCCYQDLRDWAATLGEVTGKEVALFHSSSDNIIPVEDLNPKEQSIMVLDDVMLEQQALIEPYFARGRHGGANCFYLTQDFFHIPNGAIRNNANLLVLFNQTGKDQRAIHDIYVRGDMPLDEFYNFCSECWDQPYGFAVIDRTSKVYDGKYRCGFDRFYTPKSSN